MCKDMNDYITQDEPFGPIDTVDIDDGDIDVLQALFEQHNRLYQDLRRRPSIIIGRKGSGKTAYLRSVFFDKQYSFYTEIKTPQAFGEVINMIQKVTKDALFPETVAEIWEIVIWVSVFSTIKKHLKSVDDKAIINDYLSKIGIRDEDNIDSVLWAVADIFSERLKEKPLGVISELLRRFDKVNFNDARDVVKSFLLQTNKNFVILMDSMENLDLEIPTVHRSLQGLLKLIGSMNKPKDVVDVRFCLPAEIYHSFSNEISSNPNKDFRRSLVLQWTAPELISIGSQRLKIFFSLYNNRLFEKAKYLDPAKKENAIKIFSLALPTTIHNQYGFSENTLAYIIRHTQLLPRHFLMLLNSIFSFVKKHRKQSLEIAEEDVRAGIRQIEERIVTEIYVAFKSRYPVAEKVCKACIPELEHHFTLGKLQKVFTQYGKKHFGYDDFSDFKRMLLEIGAVGRYISETNVYYKAVFEYIVPHELVTSVDDTYCLHPIFSGIYSHGKNSKPVYPYGSELDDEDYRDNE